MKIKTLIDIAVISLLSSIPVISSELLSGSFANELSFFHNMGIYTGSNVRETGQPQTEMQTQTGTQTQPAESADRTETSECVSKAATQTGTKEDVQTGTQAEQSAAAKAKALIGSFECVSQYPELPTGCEVTALAMALNFIGYEVTKTELADDYLTKGEIGCTNPNKAFVGNPRDAYSYGCYAPVIVDCAVAYGAQAVDVSKSGVEDLFDYIEAGQPVIVWATIEMKPTYFGSAVWLDEAGERIVWNGNEHVLVLIGYDYNNSTVSLADPRAGAVVDYDMNTFIKHWNEQGCQAVIVW